VLPSTEVVCLYIGMFGCSRFLLLGGLILPLEGLMFEDTVADGRLDVGKLSILALLSTLVTLLG